MPFISKLLLLLLVILFYSPRPAAVLANTGCPYNPWIDGMLSQTSQEAWTGWITRLSGEIPVQVGGQTTTLLSRHNKRMFGGDPQARAYDYVVEQVTRWLGSRANIQQPSYLMYKPPDDVYNAKNLVIDIPGQTRPEEIVVLSAHLDSLSTRLDALAPGADDNASGVAAVLEAARLFRQYRFARTLRLIIFTGEEAVEVGSRAYLADYPPTGVIAAINLDMIAYDKDNDRCMELHTGPLAASLPPARCIQESIAAYQLDLKTEIVSAGATDQSDQSSFWAHGVGAVLLWENTTIPAAGDGICAGTDANPFYHTPNDRLDRLNLETGFSAARAGIAATAALAQPLGACRSEACGAENSNSANLYWQTLQDWVN